MQSDIYISVKGITQRFGVQEVLKGVSFDVRRGELLALIGGSGAGKSVMLKHLDGLLDPIQGEILIEGKKISNVPEREKAILRKGLGLMFQNGALFDSMTVFENVAFPLREAGVHDEEEVELRVQSALDSVYLSNDGEKMPADLSGGMIKRVAVARAIIMEPDCLMYDEPTAGLDPIVTDSISYLIREINIRHNKTTIIVSHDMGSVLRIADRIVYLREGLVYWSGTPGELIESRDPVCSAFLRGDSGEDWRTLSSGNPLDFMEKEIINQRK